MKHNRCIYGPESASTYQLLRRIRTNTRRPNSWLRLARQEAVIALGASVATVLIPAPFCLLPAVVAVAVTGLAILNYRRSRH